MIIGISGAQSVGKTTLLNALRSEQSLKNYNFCTEVTRTVKEYGLSINESGTGNTQKLIMQEHITNIFLYDNMITDRTALDGLVYTTYLYRKGQVSQKIYSFVNTIFDKLINKYNLLFYILPEFDIEENGIRSTRVEFRDDIVHIFDEVMINKKNFNYIKLSGSVRSRVEQVLNHIRE